MNKTTLTVMTIGIYSVFTIDAYFATWHEVDHDGGGDNGRETLSFRSGCGVSGVNLGFAREDANFSRFGFGFHFCDDVSMSQAFFLDGVIPKDSISDEEDEESEITKVSCRVLFVSNTLKMLVLESIISQLPAEKGAVSCSFLLKILKAASILRAPNSSKMEVARWVALRLEDTRVGYLLIPSVSLSSETVRDVDRVMIMLEEIFLNCRGRVPRPIHPGGAKRISRPPPP
nr:BTB/POZ domain-containing protein At1g67900-like [Ipomoea trifida]